MGKCIFRDKQSIEMSPHSTESPRELRPRAGGTGMLTLDIKQHFIPYYGVTTTLYNGGFLKCHSQTVGYEAYRIDIIYCRSQPDSTSSYRGTTDSCTSLNHYANVTVTQTQRHLTACACDSKLSLSLRNLLAHLMRPRQNVGTKSDFASLS